MCRSNWCGNRVSHRWSLHSHSNSPTPDSHNRSQTHIRDNIKKKIYYKLKSQKRAVQYTIKMRDENETKALRTRDSQKRETKTKDYTLLRQKPPKDMILETEKIEVHTKLARSHLLFSVKVQIQRRDEKSNLATLRWSCAGKKHLNNLYKKSV